MDLFTANAAHSLHSHDAPRSDRELEYRRRAKERAELRAATEEATGLTSGAEKLSDVPGRIDSAFARDGVDHDDEVTRPPIGEEQGRGHVLVQDAERNAILDLCLVADHP